MKAVGAVRWLPIPLVVGLALAAGCGPTTAASAVSPVSSAAAKAGRTIELTNADAGRTIDVHLHQAIHVQLTGQAWEGGTWAWSKPSASDAKILHTQNAYETRGGYAYGRFHGIRQGRATILSVFMCRAKAPGAVCTRLGRLWRVTINVVS